MKSPYERMMRKVVKVEKPAPNDHWLFMGALDQNGHGNVRSKKRGKWSCDKAHRIAFEHHHGPLAEDEIVRHKCDVHNCVNPAHLEDKPGTVAQNNRDIVERGRHRNQHSEPREDPVPF